VRTAGIRDSLVVVLTITTGATNAASFLALGRVFSSVITGNLVLLGLAADTHGGGQAFHAGLALGGYAAGVLAAVPIAAWRRGGRTWPAGVTAALAAEACLLAAFTVGWESASGHPGGGLKVLLLVLLAAGMGMQSAAVRRLGQMSSTYLTSTLTGVLAGLITGRRPDRLGRSVGVLVMIVVGALCGAILLQTASAWFPALLLCPLLLVIAAATATAAERPPTG
jgi:uncharacterized membrane protein YoaK (UPF0700 family)